MDTNILWICISLVLIVLLIFALILGVMLICYWQAEENKKGDQP